MWQQGNTDNGRSLGLSAVCIVGLLVVVASANAQEDIGPNPFGKNAQAERDGAALFQSRCSGCHGSDATGVTGPNLIAAVNRGITDERLYLTILKGIAGTSMPAYTGGGDHGETDVWKLLSYLLTLRSLSPDSAVPQGPSANISWQDLLDGLKNPGRWLTYSGDLRGQRHSPLTQVTPRNVANLTPLWTFQAGTVGKFEASPIVIDGVVYMTGSNNYAWAIDAKTGRQIWRYRRDLPAGTKPCCGTVNRGFGVLGGKLFMTTLDAHLIALDIRNGTVLWDSELADFKIGYAATIAPLVVKETVMAGVAGGEYGIRGSVQGFDPSTGKRKWIFYTTVASDGSGGNTWSRDSWKTGGAPVWAPGAYDPETNTAFFGTGNPGPDYDGSVREGDNLYACSLLALDPETGKLKWYFQFTPHDVHDWDAAQTPIVADIRIAGQLRKVVMTANRNGFFYTLDRLTGKHIVAKPFVTVDWAKEIGPDGRPVLNPGHEPTSRGSLTCPDVFGGTNFNPASFDPSLGLVFVNVRERCQLYSTFKEEYVPGQQYRAGGGSRTAMPEYGAVRAIDPTSGDRRWEFKYENVGFPGVLSTASGLVFAGDASGNIHALESRTGKDLWWYHLGFSADAYQSGTGIYAGPSTFMVGDRQFIMIPSGATLTAFALAVKR